jgi:hypothetical protein
MSNFTNLVLHFALDDIDKNRQIIDRSGNQDRVPLDRRLTILPDEVFGGSLHFDDRHQGVDLVNTVIPIGSEITICWWMNWEDDLPADAIVLCAQDPNKIEIVKIGLRGSDSHLYFDCGNDDKKLDRIDRAIQLSDLRGKWTHWAVTKNATTGEMKIYLNGELWHSESGKTQPIPDLQTVKLGSSSDGSANYQGKLTNLRIYNQALSPAAIQAVLAADRTALVAFRSSYPLDFSLADDNDRQILYINEDPAGYDLHWEIENTTTQAIALIPPTQQATASADLYHFALKFRPETLASSTLDLISIQEANWSQSHRQLNDRTIELYLLSTIDRLLDPLAKLPLTLQHINAEAGGGARGTRVEFKYQQLNYVGDVTPLSGNRTKHLDIVNQRGRKNIPLHVGFVGGNTILNDGKSSNQLTLRLTNTLKDAPLALNPTGSNQPSQLIISFEIDSDWALGTKSQVDVIEIEGKDWVTGANGRSDWAIVKTDLGQSPEWILTYQNQANPTLNPGEVVEISIQNIISSLPSGNTNLYVRYENIPGYWDGQFVVTIDKAPIIYRDIFNPDGTYAGKTNVGIGTNEPSALLSIDPQGAGGIVIGNPDPNAKDYTSLNLNISADKNGYSSLQSVRSAGSTWGTLALNPAGGNVGIGTTDPQRPFHVGEYLSSQASTGVIRCAHTHGDTFKSWDFGVGDDSIFGHPDYFGFRCVENQVTSLVLDAWGQVGIGTTTPQAKLDVNGSIHSPMWRAITVFENTPGPLPITSGKFTTGGGTLMIFASGSAYRSNFGTIGMDIFIDDRYCGNAIVFTNEANSHKLIASNFITTGIPAGQHSATIKKFSDAPETTTDVNDHFSLTILELPF